MLCYVTAVLRPHQRSGTFGEQALPSPDGPADLFIVLRRSFFQSRPVRKRVPSYVVVGHLHDSRRLDDLGHVVDEVDEQRDTRSEPGSSPRRPRLRRVEARRSTSPRSRDEAQDHQGSKRRYRYTSPRTICKPRSPMKLRSNRGEYCPETSVRVTMVRENTVAMTVIRLPEMAARTALSPGGPAGDDGRQAVQEYPAGSGPTAGLRATIRKPAAVSIAGTNQKLEAQALPDSTPAGCRRLRYLLSATTKSLPLKFQSAKRILGQRH